MTTPTITTAYHCPCCGIAMNSIVNTFEFPTYTRHVVQVTCWQPDCQFATFTVSPDRANDRDLLRDTYHIDKRFDVITGEKIG